MAKAVLIADNGHERIFEIVGNRFITIKIEDDLEISYWENGTEIGAAQDFVFLEDEMDYNKFLLARMFVPIERVGLGRATIEFFKEYNDGSKIYARPNDGIHHSDGSYLTGDAPIFVDRMIEEGLLIDNRDKGND